MSLRVELVSPERVAYSGEAKMVIARVASGDIAFLDGHIPFVGVLQTHPLRIVADDGAETVIAVHQGFVQVADDVVTILSDVCELADDIDVARAERARDAAEAALRADAADEDAVAGLLRARVRLDVAGATAGVSRAH
ncbi:MAG: F0F1 ATP synthase subunit epsilon [Microthrixaceae bacterium]